MKKLMINWLFAFILSLNASLAYALDSQLLPDIKEGVVTMQLQDPARVVGYTVGDVLTRQLTITIKKPYKLIDESLPIIGYQKRYRGQPLGIDLGNISHTKKEDGGSVIHAITLSYQIWTNKTTVKNGALPAEYLHIINVDSKGKEVVKFRIPSFEIAISPIAAFGQVKIQDDMSKYRGPLLIDNTLLKKRLKVFLMLLALSLLGLLYMLGKHAWLPRMGGPFARSYRQVRKLPNNTEGIQQAVTSMHTAFNTTAGNSLFSVNLDDFLAKKPAFNAIKSEMQQFFGLSRQVFFEPNAQHQVGNDPIQWLAQFSRRCRDCERGLVPDILVPDSKT